MSTNPGFNGVRADKLTAHCTSGRFNFFSNAGRCTDGPARPLRRLRGDSRSRAGGPGEMSGKDLDGYLAAEFGAGGQFHEADA